MKLRTLIYSILALALLASCNETQESETSLRIIDGYILSDKNDPSLLYLQDMESAELIELRFVNDSASDLNFDDFGHVEVIGQYNSKYNFLVVEQILDTRELLVLDPVKSIIY